MKRPKSLLQNSLYLFGIFLFGIISTFAQGPEQAKNLISQVANQIKNENSIDIEFTFTLDNKKEDIRQESEGKALIKKNKYILDILGVTQLYDGKQLYTIIPENEEITISTEEDSESPILNPLNILSVYEKGYTYAWDIEQNVQGEAIQFIKLTPIESSEVNYVLIGINIAKSQLYKLIEIGKNNTRTTLSIIKYLTDVPLEDRQFVFNEADYPDFFINN